MYMYNAAHVYVPDSPPITTNLTHAVAHSPCKCWYTRRPGLQSTLADKRGAAHLGVFPRTTAEEAVQEKKTNNKS